MVSILIKTDLIVSSKRNLNMQITLLSIVVVFFLYVLLYVLLHVFPLPCESMKPQSVGDANRCMHA